MTHSSMSVTETRLLANGATLIEPDSEIVLQSPLGNELMGRSGTYTIKPSKLLVPTRLDIAVKLLYAQMALNRQSRYDEEYIKRLYRQHIMIRTGGAEPYAGQTKSTLHDYEFYFNELIKDMSRSGFDLDDPIQISGIDGQVLNGAHRLAVAIALDLEKVSFRVDRTSEGRAWDMQWFKNNGFKTIDLEAISEAWLDARPKESNIAIFWPPLIDQFDKALDILSENAALIQAFRYDFGAGFEEFVFDVYSFQHGATVQKTQRHIVEKAARLSSFGSEVAIAVFDTPQNADSLKANLREKLKQNELSIFDTLHIADSSAERASLAAMVLDRHNLMSYTLTPPLSDHIVDRIDKLNNLLDSKKLPRESVCVVGGSVLELWGIKQADDLDIVIAPEYRRKLSSSSAVSLGENIDLVNENYFRQLPVEERRGLNDCALVYQKNNNVIRRGIKFANLEFVAEKKRYSRRAKDLSDLRLIGDFWAGLSEKDHNPAATNLSKPEALKFDVDSAFAQANNHHIAGNLSAAAAIYRTILAHKPQSCPALCGIGLCALHRGDLHAALNYFEQALKNDPEFKPAQNAMAQVKYELGRFDKAAVQKAKKE